MKHLPMKQRKDKPIAVEPPEEHKAEAAFDVWLRRGLHELFDGIANEPIPEELLRLVEGNRKK
jgi:hypothetical protein